MWREDCEYLSYKLIDDDIFGHPDYNYYCSNNKENIPRLITSWRCIKCEKYEKGINNDGKRTN